MPPKGSTRRSNRAPKSSKDDEPSKSRRGGSHKARGEFGNLDDTRSSHRTSKNGADVSPLEDLMREEEEEDSGVTRCVCDEAEAETKDMGFMVQCEQCNVWQHGNCMGIEREEDCPEKYYCEECRPDLHTALLEDLERRTKAASRRDAKKTKSLSSSRTSRSISPDGRRLQSHKSPKRRSTLNSRDTDVEMNRILEFSRKEAERAGTLPEVDLDANEGRRKRKRGVDAADLADNNRRKRSAGSPESTPSDQLNGNGEGMRGKGSKTGNNTPIDTTDSNQGSRNRRSSRKDKEQSLDVDGKIRHPNQYTYRGHKPALVANSPVKHLKNDRSDHATRRNLPQQSRGWSLSPAPLSYNIPDHFSHLAALLPHSTPQGISVRVGPEEDNRALEKGVKVRWPPKRTTIGEMRRRVRGMMEYVARAQLEAGERERRVEMLNTALVNNQQALPSALSVEKEKGTVLAVMDGLSTGDDAVVEGISGLKEKIGDTTMVDIAPVLRDTRAGDLTHLGMPISLSSVPIPAITMLSEKDAGAAPTASEAEGGFTVTPTITKLSHIATPKSSGPTTMQLLDQLTRDLIEFQERFGAGREGKVYRDRTDRERRTRAAVDVDIY